MNAEIKAAWIAALRSGQYQQGRASLRNGNRYCCLGVLCDLAAQQGIGQWDETGYFGMQGDLASLLLPKGVIEWAGLSTTNPRVGRTFTDEWRFGLADYNDGAETEGSEDDYVNVRPHTFAEIADLIEADL